MFSRLGMSIAVSCSFLATSAFSAVARNSFDNMDVKTSYSELLQEKNARNDSLLPAFDGDKAFAEVLRMNPNFWSLGGAIDKDASLVTKLNAKNRGTLYCQYDSNKVSDNVVPLWLMGFLY